MKQTLIALVGAAAGGALGFFAFFWIRRQGFYGMILPGGLLALGASIGQVRSVWLALVFGLAALGMGLFTEWRYRPWEHDDSLSYFLLHVHKLQPVTLLMIAAGGFLGFWVPYRRMEPKGPPGVKSARP